MEHPSFHRPLSAKKQKLEEKIERNVSKAAANLDEMTGTLKSSAISKKQAASISLQLKILKKMSLNPLDMNHSLNELMEKAAVLGGFEAKKEQQRSVSEHPSTVQPCRNDSSSPHSALIGNSSSYHWDEPTPSRSQQRNSNALNTSSPRTLSLVTRQIIGEGDAARAQRAQPEITISEALRLGAGAIWGGAPAAGGGLMSCRPLKALSDVLRRTDSILLTFTSHEPEMVGE
ncbi:hypothetical protein FGB62_149g021 [Gracilaria domingensis]|nr:hypothetical protein FGB62_149g021 [Gracilaria domingensis]